MVDILKALSKKLPLKDTSTRNQSGQDLTYVSNEATIRWLNEHLGLNWSFIMGDTTFERHPDDTKKGQAQWMATCVVHMRITNPDDEFSTIRCGWGAGVNFDPDTAVKTALAEAVKKASNQFGVALYLWDKETLGGILGALEDNAVAMQNYLVQKATDNGADETKESVADYYKVEPKDLADLDILKRLVIEN